MKKLLLAGLLTVGSQACQLLCGDCCDSGPVGRYDITGAILTATTSAPGGTMVLDANASVDGTTVYLHLTPQTQYIAAKQTDGGSNGVAYACSPVDPPFAEQLDSLAITSRYDFDEEHPAGTPLNDILELQDSQRNTSDFVRLPNYLQLRQGLPDQLLVLRFTGRTGARTGFPRQQFQVYYRLTNGEVHTAETVVLLWN